MRDSSPTMERSVAIVCRNLVRERSELLSIGRYELVRTLGRGGHGVVYEVRDPRRREPVALKVLYGRGPSYLYRLKREFRSLAELRHPNLVALHELSVGRDDAHFTMELVAGCDLVAYLQRQPQDLGRARAALAQLCEGVHALHIAGKLHRDLKPSNVLVTDAGRVVLLDFGLVDDADAEPSEPEGTRAYMAPEQALGAASESSDWYGFGRVLQQGLAALQAPVLGLGGARERPELRALGQLAQRLTDPDPTRRPDFAEIIATVLSGAHAPPQRAYLSRRSTQHGFVARAGELDRLADAFTRSRAQPVVVRVRGESGIGKSALLRAFASALANGGRNAAADRAGRVPADRAARVLHGRCYQRESVPYKALDSTIDELSHVLLALPAGHEARRLLPDSAALLAIFPVLGRVPWLRAEQPARDDSHPIELRARGFAALRALLARLVAERPLVLCIDDLQWSDADSGRLLGALLCEDDSPPLLVVAGDRGDAGSESLAIEELQRVAELAPRPVCVEELALEALDPEESRLLARALLADAGDGSAVSMTEVDQLADEARGNPRVLSELVRSRAERPRMATHEAGAPSLHGLLERRLAALSAPCASMLELVAASGRPLSLRVVAATGRLGDDGHARAQQLAAIGVLRAVLRGDGEWLELEHERIGEAVLARLAPEARIALHAELARALASVHGEANEALIDQYVGARMPLEAARCARVAADAALAALAFARAARLYEQALALGDFLPEERVKLLCDHALALEHSGRGLDAAAVYQRAAALSPDPVDAAHLEQRAADHLMRNGWHRQGERLLSRSYRALGLPWPESRLALALAIAGQLLPRWLRRNRPRARMAAEPLRRARAELTARAGRGLENYDVPRALYNALLSCDAGEQVPDPAWHARARGARGLLRCIAAWPGGTKRGIAELEQACAAARALGDEAASGDLHSQLAVVYYFSGQPRAALEAANHSEACVRPLSHSTIDLNAVIGVIGTALFDLGRLREARRRWHGLTHAARLHGDLMTAFWVHAQPIQLAVLFATEERERVEAILARAAQLRRAHPEYSLIGWIHAAGSLEHALYWGAPEEAVAIARRERRALYGVGLAVLNAKARLLRARACLHAASALAPGRARAALLRRAAIDTLVLRLERGPLNRGIARTLSAAIAALRGNQRRAIALLDAACSAFLACDAKLFAATTRYCKGALLGGEQGRALQQPALAAFHGEGVVDAPRYIAWIASGFAEILGVRR